jgi:signal transduction histidine kinase
VSVTSITQFDLNPPLPVDTGRGKALTASRALAVAAALLGAVVIVGWATGLEILKTGIPGAIVMLPWTGVAFALGGCSLWIYHLERRRVSLVMACLFLAIGAVMAFQRASGVDLEFNRLLFPRTLAEYPYRPVGLMASNSTVCIVLLGGSLVLLGLRKWDAIRELLAAIPMLIAFIAVLGHTYGVSSLYSLDKFAGMAPVTTFGFVILAGAVLLARPSVGVLALLVGNEGSAVLTRRLLVASVVVPVVFGRIWLELRRAEVVSRELGVSLFVVVNVVASIALIFWSAGALRRSEAVRERARADAERASRVKSEFLAVMSHELRTPLNAIRGYADILEMGIDGSLTGPQQEHVARIKKSEGHLLGLIDNLLNYTQVESGRVVLSTRDLELRPVIDEAFVLTEPRAQAKGIELIANYDGVESRLVKADPEKVLQILLNLISNAIKFSDQGGRVSLACSATDGARPMAIVEVRDSGKGIPKEMLEVIFEPFFQIDRALTRSTDGVGLGLAISRTLARAMSGDITATSEAGSGSCFRVMLPCNTPDQLAEPNSQA